GSHGDDGEGDAQAGRRRRRGRARSPPRRRPRHGHGRDDAAGTELMLRNAALVAGIGATEFSKDSGRSELHLAVEAVDAALRDAAIEPSEGEGMATFTMDSNPEIEIARNLGIGELKFFSR